jgi:hypothetical protein
MTDIPLEEECSRDTPGAYWVPGGEYWAVEVRRCVPTALLGDDEALEAWIERHIYG